MFLSHVAYLIYRETLLPPMTGFSCQGQVWLHCDDMSTMHVNIHVCLVLVMFSR